MLRDLFNRNRAMFLIAVGVVLVFLAVFILRMTNVLSTLVCDLILAPITIVILILYLKYRKEGQ